MKFIQLFLLIPFFSILACSGVYITTDELKLFGLNEDFHEYNTIYVIIPGSLTTYSVLAFGHSNSLQAIINEKGLCYDGYGAPEKEVTHNNHLPVNNGSFIFEAMTSCETVEEVEALYEQNFHPWLSNGQLFFTDRFGNSAIFEGDTIIHKTGDYQICTNYYQSDPESGIPYGFYPCWRYDLLEQELESTSEYSIEFMTEMLDNVHAEYQVAPLGQISTVYSLIIDQNAEKIYVYDLFDYENVVILDISEELQKEAQTVSLNTLFETKFKNN